MSYQRQVANEALSTTQHSSATLTSSTTQGSSGARALNAPAEDTSELQNQLEEYRQTLGAMRSMFASTNTQQVAEVNELRATIQQLQQQQPPSQQSLAAQQSTSALQQSLTAANSSNYRANFASSQSAQSAVSSRSESTVESRSIIAREQNQSAELERLQSQLESLTAERDEANATIAALTSFQFGSPAQNESKSILNQIATNKSVACDHLPLIDDLKLQLKQNESKYQTELVDRDRSHQNQLSSLQLQLQQTQSKYNLLLQQSADQSTFKNRISELETLLEQSQSKHRSALETYYAAKVQWDQDRSELEHEIDSLRQSNQHMLDEYQCSQKQVQSAAAEKGNFRKQEEDAKLQVVIMRNEITHIRESWSIERTTYEQRVVTLQQQLQACRDQEAQQWTRQINDLKAAHQVELSHCQQDRAVLQNQLAELQRIHATILAESQQNQKQIQSISDDKQGKNHLEMDALRNELKHTLESWSIEHSTYEHRISQLQKDLSASRQESEALKQQNLSCTRQVDELKTEVDRLQHQPAEATIKVLDTSLTRNEKGSIPDQHLHDNCVTSEEHENLKRQLQSEFNRFVELRIELEKYRSSAQSNENDLNRKLSDLQRSHDDNAKLLSILKSDLKHAQQQTVLLQVDNGELKLQNDDLTQQIADLKSAERVFESQSQRKESDSKQKLVMIGELNAALKSKDEIIDTQRSDIAQCKSDLRTRELELAKTQVELQNALRQHHELSTSSAAEINKLRLDNDQLRVVLLDLESQAAADKASHALTLQHERDVRERTDQEHQRQQQQLKVQFDARLEKLQRQHHEILDAQDEESNEAIRRRESDLLSIITDRDSEISELQSQLDSLKLQLEVVRGELRDCQSSAQKTLLEHNAHHQLVIKVKSEAEALGQAYDQALNDRSSMDAQLQQTKLELQLARQHQQQLQVQLQETELELQQVRTNLRQRIQELEQQVGALHHDRQELQFQLTESLQENDDLLKVINSLNQQLDTHKAVTNSIEADLEHTQKQISEQSEKHATVAARRDDEMIQLQRLHQQRVDELEALVTSLQSQLEQAHRSNQLLHEESIQLVTQQRDELTMQVSLFKSQIQELQAQADIDRARHDEESSKLKRAHQQRSDEFEHQIQTLHSKIVELESNQSQSQTLAEAELNALKREHQLHIQDLEQQIQSLQNVKYIADASQTEKQAVLVEHRDSEPPKCDHQTYIASLELKIIELEALQLSNANLITLQSERLSRKLEVGPLKVQLERSKAESIALQSKLDELEHEFNRSQQRCAQLTIQLSERQQTPQAVSQNLFTSQFSKIDAHEKLQQQVRELELVNEKLKVKFAAEQAEFEKQLNEHSDNFSSLEALLKKCVEQRNQLQLDLQSKQSAFDALSIEARAARMHATELQDERDRLRGEVTSTLLHAESEITSRHRNELNRIDAEWQQRVDALTLQLHLQSEQHARDMTSLEQQLNDEAEQFRHDSEAAQAEHARQVDRMRQLLIDQQRLVDERTAALETLRHEVAEQHEHHQHAQKTIQHQSATLNNAVSDIQSLQSQHQDEIEHLQSTIVDLSAELDQVSQELLQTRKKLHSVIDKHDQLISTHQAATTDKQTALEAQTALIEEQKVQIHQLRRDVESRARENQELSARVSELHSLAVEVPSLRLEHESRLSTLNALVIEHRTVCTELETIRYHNQTVTHDLQTAQSEVDQLRAQLQQYLHVDEQLRNLTHDFDAGKIEHQQTSHELQSLRVEHQDLTDRFNGIQSELLGVKEQNQQLSDEVQRLRSESKAQEFVVLQNDHQTLQQCFEDLNGRFVQLEHESHQSEQTLNKLKSDHSLQLQLQSQRIQQLEQQIEQLQKEIQFSTTEKELVVTELHHKLKLATLELSERTQVIDSLRDQLHETKLQLSDAQQHSDKCEHDRQEMLDSLIALKAELTQSESQLSDAQQQSRHASVQHEYALQQLRLTQQQLNEVITDRDALQDEISNIREHLHAHKSISEEKSMQMASANEKSQQQLQSIASTVRDQTAELSECRQHIDKLKSDLSSVTQERDASRQREAEFLKQIADNEANNREIDAIVRAERAQVAAELSNLKVEFETLHQSNQQAKHDHETKMAAANAEMDSLKLQISKLQAELQSLTTDRDSLQVELRQSRLEVASAHQDVQQQIRDKLAELEAALRNSQAEHESRIAELKSKHHSRVETLVKRHEEQLQSVQSEHQSALNRIDEEHDDAVAIMRQQHKDSLHQTIQELERKARQASDQLEHQLEALRADNNNMQQKHQNELDALVQQHKSDLSILESELSTVRSHLSVCQHQLEQSQVECDRLKNELQALQRAKDGSEKQLNESRAQIDNLEQLIHEKTKRALADSKENVELRQRIDLLQKEYETRHSLASERANTMMSLRDEHAEELSRTRSVLEHAEQTIDELHRMLNDNNQQLVMANKQVTEAIELKKRCEILETSLATAKQQLKEKQSAHHQEMEAQQAQFASEINRLSLSFQLSSQQAAEQLIATKQHHEDEKAELKVAHDKQVESLQQRINEWQHTEIILREQLKLAESNRLQLIAAHEAATVELKESHLKQINVHESQIQGLNQVQLDLSNQLGKLKKQSEHRRTQPMYFLAAHSASIALLRQQLKDVNFKLDIAIKENIDQSALHQSELRTQQETAELSLQTANSEFEQRINELNEQHQHSQALLSQSVTADFELRFNELRQQHQLKEEEFHNAQNESMAERDALVHKLELAHQNFTQLQEQKQRDQDQYHQNQELLTQERDGLVRLLHESQQNHHDSTLQLQAVQAELNQLRDVHQQLSEQFHTLSHDHKHTIELLNSSQQDWDSLNTSHISLMAEHQEVQIDLMRCRSTCEEYEQEIDRLRAELGQHKVVASELVAQTQSMQETAKQRITTTETELQAAHRQISELTVIVQNLNGNIHNLNAQLQANKEELDVSTDSLLSHCAQIDRLQALVQSLQQQLKEKVQEIQHLQSSLESQDVAHQQNTSRLQSVIDDFQHQVQATSLQLVELRELFESKEKEHSDLHSHMQSELAALQQQLVDSAQTVQQRDIEIQRLNSQVDELNQQLKAALQQTADERKTFEIQEHEHVTRHEKLHSEWNLISQQHNELQQTLQQRNADIDSLKVELEESQQNLQSTSQQLHEQRHLSESTEQELHDKYDKLHVEWTIVHQQHSESLIILQQRNAEIEQLKGDVDELKTQSQNVSQQLVDLQHSSELKEQELTDKHAQLHSQWIVLVQQQSESQQLLHQRENDMSGLRVQIEELGSQLQQNSQQLIQHQTDAERKERELVEQHTQLHSEWIVLQQQHTETLQMLDQRNSQFEQQKLGIEGLNVQLEQASQQLVEHQRNAESKERELDQKHAQLHSKWVVLSQQHTVSLQTLEERTSQIEQQKLHIDELKLQLEQSSEQLVQLHLMSVGKEQELTNKHSKLHSEWEALSHRHSEAELVLERRQADIVQLQQSVDELKSQLEQASQQFVEHQHDADGKEKELSEKHTQLHSEWVVLNQQHTDTLQTLEHRNSQIEQQKLDIIELKLQLEHLSQQLAQLQHTTEKHEQELTEKHALLHSEWVELSQRHNDSLQTLEQRDAEIEQQKLDIEALKLQLQNASQELVDHRHLFETTEKDLVNKHSTLLLEWTELSQQFTDSQQHLHERATEVDQLKCNLDVARRQSDQHQADLEQLQLKFSDALSTWESQRGEIEQQHKDVMSKFAADIAEIQLTFDKKSDAWQKEKSEIAAAMDEMKAERERGKLSWSTEKSELIERHEILIQQMQLEAQQNQDEWIEEREDLERQCEHRIQLIQHEVNLSQQLLTATHAVAHEEKMAQITDLQSEIEQCREQCDQSVSQLQGEKDALIEELKHAKEAAERQRADSEAQVAELQSQLDAAREQYEQSASEWTCNRQSLVDELNQTRADAEQLKSQLDSMIVSLQAEIELLQSQISQLTSQQQDLNQELIQAHEQTQRLEEELMQTHAEAEKSNSESDALIVSLQADVTKLTTQLQDLSLELNQARDQAVLQKDESDALVSQLQTTIEILQAEMIQSQTQWQDEQHTLSEQLTQCRNEAAQSKSESYTLIADLKAELDRHRQEFEHSETRRQSERHDLEEELIESRTNADLLKSEYDEAKVQSVAMIASLHAEIQLLQSQIGQLTSQQQDLNAELSQTREQKQKLTDELAQTCVDADKSKSGADAVIANLNQQVNELREQSEQSLSQWNVERSRLLADLSQSRSHLTQSQSESDGLIAQLRAECEKVRQEFDQSLVQRKIDHDRMTDELSQAREHAVLPKCESDALVLQLQTTIDTLQNQLDHSKTQSDALVETLQAKIAQLTTEQQDLSLRLKTTLEQKQSLEVELAQTRTHADKSKSVADAVIAALKKDIDELREQSEQSLSQWNVERSRLMADLSQSRSHLTQSQSESDGLIAQLRAECEKVRQEFDQSSFQWKQDRDRATEELTQARQQAAQQKDASDALVSQLQTFFETLQIERNQSKIEWQAEQRILTEQLTQCRDEAEQSKSHADALVADLKANIERHRRQFDDSEARWQSEKMKLEEELIQIRTNADQFKSESQEARSLSEALVVSLQVEIAQLTSQQQDLSQELNQARELTHKLDAELVQTRTDAEKSKSDSDTFIVSLQAEITTLTSKLQESSLELNQTLEQKHNLEVELAQARAAADKSKSEADAVIANLNKQVNELCEQSEQSLSQWNIERSRLLADLSQSRSHLTQSQTESDELIAQLRADGDKLQRDSNALVLQLQTSIDTLRTQMEQSKTRWQDEQCILSEQLIQCRDEAVQSKSHSDALIAKLKAEIDRHRQQFDDSEARWRSEKQELADKLEHARTHADKSKSVADAVIAALKKDIDEHRDQSEQSLSQWNVERSRLMADLTQSRSHLTQSQAESDEMIAQLRAECDKLRQELDQATAQWKQDQDRVTEELAQARAQSQLAKSEQEQQISALNLDIEKLRQHAEQSSTQWENEQRVLSEELCQTRILANQSKFDSDATIAQLQSQIEILNARFKALEFQHKEERQHLLDALNQSQENAQTQKSDFEDLIAQLQSQLHDSRQHFEQATIQWQQERDSWTEQLNQSRDHASRSQSESEALIAQLQTQLDEARRTSEHAASKWQLERQTSMNKINQVSEHALQRKAETDALVSHLQSKFDQHLVECGKDRQTWQKLNSDLKAVNVELMQRISKITQSSQDDHSALTRKCDEMSAECLKLEEDLQHQSNEVQKLRDEMSAKTVEWSSERAGLIASHSVAVAEFQQQLLQLSSKCDHLEAVSLVEQTKSTEQVTTLQEGHRRLKTTIDEQISSINQLKQELAQAESTTKAHSEKSKAAQAELQQLSTELGKVRADNVAQTNNFASLQKRFVVLQTEITEKETEIERLTIVEKQLLVDQQQLQVTLTNTQTALQQSQIDAQSDHSELLKLRTQLGAADSERLHLSQQLAEALEQIDNHQLKIIAVDRDLKSQVESSLSEQQQIEQSLIDAMKEIDVYRAKLDEQSESNRLQVAEVQQKLDTADQHVVTLQQQLSDQNQHCNKLNDEVEKLKSEISKLLVQLSKKRVEFQMMTKQNLRRFEAEKQALSLQIQTLESELSQLKAHLNDSHNRHAALEKSAKQTEVDNQTQIRLLEVRLQSVEHDLQQTKHTSELCIIEKDTQLSTYQADLRAQQQKSSELEVLLAHSKQEIQNLLVGLNDNEAKLLHQLSQQAAADEVHRVELTSKLSQSHIECERLKNDLEASQQRHQECNTELAALKFQLQQTNIDNAQKDHTIAHLHLVLKQTQNDFEIRTGEYKELKQQLVSLTQEHVSLSGLLASAMSDLQASVDKNGKLESSLTACQHELNNHKTEKQNEIQLLQADVEQAQALLKQNGDIIFKQETVIVTMQQQISVHITRTEELQRELTSKSDLIDSLQTDLVQCRQQLQDVEHQFSDANAANVQSQLKISELELLTEQSEQHVKTSQEELAQVRLQLHDRETELNEQHSAEVMTLNERLQQLQVELDESQTQNQSMHSVVNNITNNRTNSNVNHKTVNNIINQGGSQSLPPDSEPIDEEDEIRQLKEDNQKLTDSIRMLLSITQAQASQDSQEGDSAVREQLQQSLQQQPNHDQSAAIAALIERLANQTSSVQYVSNSYSSTVNTETNIKHIYMSETHEQGSFYQEEPVAAASSFTDHDQVKQEMSSLNVELLNTIAQRDQLSAELENVKLQTLTFEQAHRDHLLCIVRIQQLTAEIDRLQLELQASKDSLTTITKARDELVEVSMSLEQSLFSSREQCSKVISQHEQNLVQLRRKTVECEMLMREVQQFRSDSARGEFESHNMLTPDFDMSRISNGANSSLMIELVPDDAHTPTGSQRKQFQSERPVIINRLENNDEPSTPGSARGRDQKLQSGRAAFINRFDSSEQALNQSSSKNGISSSIASQRDIQVPLWYQPDPMVDLVESAADVSETEQQALQRQQQQQQVVRYQESDSQLDSPFARSIRQKIRTSEEQTVSVSAVPMSSQLEDLIEAQAVHAQSSKSHASQFKSQRLDVSSTDPHMSLIESALQSPVIKTAEGSFASSTGRYAQMQSKTVTSSVAQQSQTQMRTSTAQSAAAAQFKSSSNTPTISGKQAPMWNMGSPDPHVQLIENAVEMPSSVDAQSNGGRMMHASKSVSGQQVQVHVKQTTVTQKQSSRSFNAASLASSALSTLNVSHTTSRAASRTASPSRLSYTDAGVDERSLSHMSSPPSPALSAVSNRSFASQLHSFSSPHSTIGLQKSNSSSPMVKKAVHHAQYFHAESAQSQPVQSVRYQSTSQTSSVTAPSSKDVEAMAKALQSKRR